MYNLSYPVSKLQFGPGHERKGNDFRIISSSPNIGNTYENLIFTDSKGSCIENKVVCWTDKLIEEFKSENKTFLFISRPKDMTTFITLVNFLDLNMISFKNLITNVGYADLTPSKFSFIEDIKKQISNTVYDLNLVPKELEKYKLSAGSHEILYSYNFGKIENLISNYLSNKFENIILLGTMFFSKKINLKRHRPNSFYKKLRESNDYIKKICSYNQNINFFNPIPNQNSKLKNYAHDGVHFTSEGHNLFFKNFVTYLKQDDIRYFKK